MASDQREPETRILYIGEAALIYCFSFENDPTVAGGETLSAPAMTVDIARVTFGAPTVLTSDFVQYDENGLVVRTVLSGKGIRVAVTPVTRGECQATCLVNASGGSTVARVVNFTVK